MATNPVPPLLWNPNGNGEILDFSSPPSIVCSTRSPHFQHLGLMDINLLSVLGIPPQHFLTHLTPPVYILAPTLPTLSCEIGTKSDPFTGEPTDYVWFRQDCELFLHLNQHIYQSNDQHIFLVLSRLAPGLPTAWKTQWISLNTIEGIYMLLSLQIMWNDLKKAFEDKNEAGNAIYDINQLQQGTMKADKLVIRFKLLLSKTSIPTSNND